jgi:hypothetical protein
MYLIINNLRVFYAKDTLSNDLILIHNKKTFKVLANLTFKFYKEDYLCS